jgi:hypothetical protein
VYNRVTNRPSLRENARPETVIARDTTPLRMESDAAIVELGQAAE